MIRKGLIIAILATFCLTATLFFVKPTKSQTAAVHDYDPWTDLNDDGGIDGGDLSIVAARFGTAGDPINTTALRAR